MSELRTDPNLSKLPVDEVETRAEKPRRSNSWEAKNAIIYDASNQTLSKEKKANIDESARRIRKRQFAHESDFEYRRIYEC
jgi:hypothetical protein